MKTTFKHGYRRQRAADGLPSVRQIEKEKRVTHSRRVADESAAVEARRVERDARLKADKISVQQEEWNMRRG